MLRLNEKVQKCAESASATEGKKQDNPDNAAAAVIVIASTKKVEAIAKTTSTITAHSAIATQAE